MKEIPAGEVFELSCPEGSVPSVKTGDKIPSENSLIRILKINGNTVTIGPLRTGEIAVTVPCSNGTAAHEQLVVKELSAEMQGQRFNPLEAAPFPFPWLWLMCILAVILFLSLGTWFFFKKKKVPPKIIAQAPVVNPRHELEKLLQFFSREVPTPEPHHMHQLYKATRAFVENELHLTTHALTTGEFLGTFRALALKQSTNQSFVANLEYVLKTADDVRFAGRALNPESWKDYLKREEALLKAIQAPPEQKGIKR